MPLRTFRSHPSLLYRISGSGLVIGFCAVVVALNCALALHKLSQDRIAVQEEAATLARTLSQHLVLESLALIKIGDMALRLVSSDEQIGNEPSQNRPLIRNPLFVGSPVIDIWTQSPAASVPSGLSLFVDDGPPGQNRALLLTRPLPPGPQGATRSGHVLLNADHLRDFTPNSPQDFAPRLTLYDRSGQAIFTAPPERYSHTATLKKVISTSNWEEGVTSRLEAPDNGLTAEVQIAQAVIDHHAAHSLLSMIPYALAQTGAVLFCGALALNRIHREHEAVMALQTAHDTLEERVTQRTAALELINHRLETALMDKETLLREVQHRVLNNLQVVNSLLRLQAGRLPETARHGFEESRRRLTTLTLLQGRLLSSPRPGQVEMASLLKELGETAASHKDAGPAILHTDLKEWWLDADAASPVLLIADEALSNAFVHAFPTPDILPEAAGSDPASAKIVRISNHCGTDGQCWLDVQDNGVGLPGSGQTGPPEHQHKPGLGLTLVDLLARQLRARLTIESSTSGTTITLTLPAPVPA